MKEWCDEMRDQQQKILNLSSLLLSGAKSSHTKLLLISLFEMVRIKQCIFQTLECFVELLLTKNDLLEQPLLISSFGQPQNSLCLCSLCPNSH